MEFFSFIPSIILGVDFIWMIGSTILEVYNSIFNITEHNKKNEPYADLFVENSFLE